MARIVLWPCCWSLYGVQSATLEDGNVSFINRWCVHPHKRRIDLCNRALDSVRPIIPAELVRDVDDYINKHDEWGLGIEILIDQLAEFEIKISPEQFTAIHSAMESMGLSESDRVAYLRLHNISA